MKALEHTHHQIHPSDIGWVPNIYEIFFTTFVSPAAGVRQSYRVADVGKKLVPFFVRQTNTQTKIEQWKQKVITVKLK